MKLYIITQYSKDGNLPPIVLINKLEAYNMFKCIASEFLYSKFKKNYQDFGIMSKNDVDIILREAEYISENTAKVFEDKIYCKTENDVLDIQIFEIDI